MSSDPIDPRIVETSLPPEIDVLDLAPVATEPFIWVVLGTDGRLVRLDCAAADSRELGRVELQEEPGHEPWFGRPLTPRLHVSNRGDFVAVVNDYASLGAVYDARTTARTREVDGGNYHRETVPLSLAFVDHGGRTLVVHRTAWNRLDVSDAATGELLTARQPTSFVRGEPIPPHYLDYFHGRLFVSPNGSRILDDGWVWHPVGIPCVWGLRAWLDSNPWESEDGSTRLCLAARDSYWDNAMCWLDSDRVAIGGIGDDEEDMTAGARIFAAAEAAASAAPGQWPFARELTAFAGPGGEFFGDGARLFSANADGLSVWDVESGERTAFVEGFRPSRQHAGSRELVELSGSVLRRWRY